MDTFKIKSGDLEPALVMVCTSNGQPIRIDSARSVTVVIKPQRGSTVIRAAATNLDDGSAAKRGQVRYAWAPGNTNTPGTYHVEVEIEWTAGRVQTFPGNGFALMSIEASLG